ncbi:hypothetical protein AX16_006342 [Volvariella volvacea WC 439]|nr:hypothetical protein AX16_006342 [Volvariella volvacea WC 439]
MREIVYIQAGTLANYTGTHFWNTQECYFTYGDEEDANPIVNHDVSFREGISPSGKPTYSPRVVVFDYKSKFGTLSASTALFGENSSEAEASLWDGSVIEHMQERIPQSSYLTKLEESDPTDGHTGLSALNSSITQKIDDIRFWSDYRHTDFTPKSIQQVADPPDWEDALKTWSAGQELFSRFNEEHEFTDSTFRQFLEECDCPQGIHVMNDAGNFGSFTNSLLVAIRDEYAKMPSLVFPFLSMDILKSVDTNVKGTKAVLNDALYLRSLYEVSSLTVPMQSPSTWSRNAWGKTIHPNLRYPYHTSAILSAHIETATLPLRLKGTREDLSSFVGQLNWRKSTPFGELSGTFPVQTPFSPGHDLYNFSLNELAQESDSYAWRNVTRGLSTAELSAHADWHSQKAFHDTFIRVDAPAYPLPTSFPPFFTYPDPSAQAVPSQLILPKSAKVMSTLGTTSATSTLFSGYARFAEGCTKHTHDMDALGIDVDELRDLVNDLWTIHDNFSDDRASSVADSIGEDE